METSDLPTSHLSQRCFESHEGGLSLFAAAALLKPGGSAHSCISVAGKEFVAEQLSADWLKSAEY